MLEFPILFDPLFFLDFPLIILHCSALKIILFPIHNFLKLVLFVLEILAGFVETVFLLAQLRADFDTFVLSLSDLAFEFPVLA